MTESKVNISGWKVRTREQNFSTMVKKPWSDWIYAGRTYRNMLKYISDDIFFPLTVEIDIRYITLVET